MPGPQGWRLRYKEMGGRPKRDILYGPALIAGACLAAASRLTPWLPWTIRTEFLLPAHDFRPWWPATLTAAEGRPWRQESQGQFAYNTEFLGHGSEEQADYEYLPVAQLRPYRRHGFIALAAIRTWRYWD